VTTTTDSGNGSLRQAILDANMGTTAATINFDLTYPATITLSSGALNVTQSVTIPWSWREQSHDRRQPPPPDSFDRQRQERIDIRPQVRERQ
jgi:hypothetical protein